MLIIQRAIGTYSASESSIHRVLFSDAGLFNHGKRSNLALDNVHILRHEGSRRAQASIA